MLEGGMFFGGTRVLPGGKGPSSRKGEKSTSLGKSETENLSTGGRR